MYIHVHVMHDSCIPYNYNDWVQKRELESSGKHLSKEEHEKKEKQKQEELRRELQKVKQRRLVSSCLCMHIHVIYVCMCTYMVLST